MYSDHPQSTPPLRHVSAWLAAHIAAPRPASPRRSTARPPPSDGATDACDEHCPEPSAPPSARHSYDHQAITIRCSSSSEACADRRASRRYARPSIYAAKRLCCGPGEERRDPTKQYYIKMFVFNTVILGGLLPIDSTGSHVMRYGSLVSARQLHAGTAWSFRRHGDYTPLWLIDVHRF